MSRYNTQVLSNIRMLCRMQNIEEKVLYERAKLILSIYREVCWSMKSVQGDSGHAQVKMVADVYSHIIDDDRRLNAERMEAAFYSGRQTTTSEPVQSAATESSADDKELLLKLLQNPEMAALLKSLAKTL